MARLETYTSSPDLLNAVIPHILPDREWQSHLLLGLNLENARRPINPLDLYATTWVDDELQLALFHFHNSPINITPCREAYDLRQLSQQLQLLVEYITSQPAEIMDGYSLVTGPDNVSTPFVSLLSKALGCEVIPVMDIRGSYVDRKKFVPYPIPDPTHTIRQAKVDDNITQMATLVHGFQLHTAALHAPMSLEELIDVLPSPITRGLYYIYILPDGSIAAVCMVRRTTPRGICITMLFTDEEHRGRGYGAALTSYVIQRALDPVESGGRGKDHVCIFWETDGDASRIYKRLGFVEGQTRIDWKLQPASDAVGTERVKLA